MPFFTSKSLLNRGKKGHPPQTYAFYFPFIYTLSVAAMSTSPHEIDLCPMLPHHFLLHAKSLLGPTLKAPPKPEAGFHPLPSQAYIYIYTYTSLYSISFLWKLACQTVQLSPFCGELCSFGCILHCSCHWLAQEHATCKRKHPTMLTP